MNVQPSSEFLLGVFELDEKGKVLYSSFESPEGITSNNFSLDGSDFFKEIAIFNNAEDLQCRFESFRSAGNRSISFEYTCDYDHSSHKVRIVFARLITDSAPPSFLVHFRRH